MSIDRVRAAAEDLQAALSAYDPGAMRQLLRDVPTIGAALDGVSTGVRSVASRAEDAWPTAAPVAEALYTMAGDLRTAAQTAGVADAMHTHHGGDIERHDAPRGGSRAAEARWDVSHPGVDDDGTGGRHRAPDTQEATVATAQRPSTSPPDGSTAVQEQIRQAYRRLVTQSSAYVSLAAIREAVPTRDRQQVDEALTALLDDDRVRLEPEPFGFRLGPREKEAALYVGGDDRHLLRIDGVGPADPPPAATATAEPALRPGGFDPNQPRGADGKWVAVGDELGYADDEICHATTKVRGTGRVPTTLALMDYDGDRYVAVATPRHGGWNPVTSCELGDGGGLLYAAPHLSPREADAAAMHLAELANLVEEGYQPPKPTRYSRAAQHLQHLVDVKNASPGDKIGVGDEDEFPLTVRELLGLLRDKDPTPSVRRKVQAAAIGKAGGDTGTVWMDIESGPEGQTRIVVTAVEGDESPDSDYNRKYTAEHTPGTARELATKLCAFARAGRTRFRRP